MVTPRRPRSHGFFRFFAWEAIVALFLLNVAPWFVDPLSWNQVISWFLLAFEKTTRLVTIGIYACIRHPLYSSLLLLTWGILFKHPPLPGAVLALVSTLFLVLTALADEAECAAFFGPEYAAYKRRTRRFIPFLF